MTSAQKMPWAGHTNTIELTVSDAEAMDIALALVPELRLAALAISRARKLGVRYPIESTGAIISLLEGEQKLSLGGHEIDAAAIRQYLVAGDFPVNHEGELANAVYIALTRCRQHQHLQQSLKLFEEGIASDADKGGRES